MSTRRSVSEADEVVHAGKKTGKIAESDQFSVKITFAFLTMAIKRV
jgi:hypothetical protein